MTITRVQSGSIAGISLLIMTLAAGFAFGYAHTSLVADTPGQTLANLLENKTLFFAEIFGWVVIFITDITVAIALYFFFSGTSKQASLLTAIVRILYTCILGVAIFQLFSIASLLLLPDIESSPAYADDINAFLVSFDTIWSFGLILFGFHLLGLGYLCLKSRNVPSFFGYLLYFGGVGYSAIHAMRQLDLVSAESLTLAENILALPMGLSEVLFAFWLIYHGFKHKN